MIRSLSLARLAHQVPRGVRSVATSAPRRRMPSSATWFFRGIAFAGVTYLAVTGLPEAKSVEACKREREREQSAASVPSKPALSPIEAMRARYGSPADYAAAVKELQAAFDEDAISVDDEDREHHGNSPWTHGINFPPSAIVYPQTTEEVQVVMRIASKYRVPVVPYGNGTSLEGQFSAPFGGICVDMSRMDRILAIHPTDGDVVVQAGLGYETLNSELKKQGINMFLPLDPGPNASIGGMIGTGCSGTNSVRYGTARAEWFLNVTAVLPDGTILKTRQRSRKSSAGPDMTKLFIGAEGTLGIVTEVTIRLAPLLPTRVGVVAFPSVRNAVNAVVDILNDGVQVQCVELLDDLQVAAVNHSGIVERPLAEKDSIFFKFQGNDTVLEDSVRVIQEIAAKHGGNDVQFAQNEKESEDIWAARKAVLFASLGHSGYETPMLYGNDVCVPISRLPDLVEECKAEFKERGIYAPIVGHVGDGNFHATIIMRGAHEVPAISELMGDIIRRAQAMEGTCTGEHGVGVNKKKYLRAELGDGTLHLMKTIKDAIDPLGIMNPGKLYPDELMADETPKWAPPATPCC